MQAFRPMIVFLVAWMDGTGSLERFLGAHAVFLEAHCGGDDIVNDTAEKCLEISREGPSTEAEVFEKVGGVLRFIEFSLPQVMAHIVRQEFRLLQGAPG